MRRTRLGLAILATLLLTACAGGGSRPSVRSAGQEGTALQCAPFARQVTGMALYGEADAWWGAAAGRYDRGPRPEPGSVLVFRRSARLPSGHVSVVSRVASTRTVLVTQANWVHARIGRDEPVTDVSPGNDWSAVRVWWEPAGSMGSAVYPTYGFIHPRPAPDP